MRTLGYSTTHKIRFYPYLQDKNRYVLETPEGKILPLGKDCRMARAHLKAYAETSTVLT
jgi:hypothetical protein